jgi:succinate dehydrogenase/fumarate reductase-like Fe-S protein
VVLSGRALALALLARSLLQVIAERLFGARTGLALFHENYDADRLPPVDAAERPQLVRFSRCIACGRCDVGEAERMAQARGAYPGLMAIVLASSRSMPDYDAAALALAHVPDDVLAAKEDVCPTGVPFVTLARFVRAKAALMHEAAPAPGAPGAAAGPALPAEGSA